MDAGPFTWARKGHNMKKSSILTILIGILAGSAYVLIAERMSRQDARLDRMVSGAWTMDSGGPIYIGASPLAINADLWLPAHRNGGTK